MSTPTKLIPHTHSSSTLKHSHKAKSFYDNEVSVDTEVRTDRFSEEHTEDLYRKRRSILTNHALTTTSDPDLKEEREWSTSEDESRTHDRIKTDPEASRLSSDIPEKRKRGRPRKDSVSERLSSPKRTCVAPLGIDNRKARGRRERPDPNRTDKTGRTKLFYFTGAGHFDKVKYLVTLGADVNFKDNAGWTPLHEAALKGQFEIAQFLISQGADVNARGFGDETPLHDAASNGHVDCVRLLVEKGADVFALDTDKQSPLDVCDDNESRKTLREKMKQLDRLVTRDDLGRTTLHRACIDNLYDDVAFLLEQGANTNAQDINARTPLHEAAAYGRAEIVKLLMKHGADINDADCKGDTILHSACRHGHQDVVRYLIDSGVDVHICNLDEKSAYDVTECAAVRQILAVRIDEERQQRATSQAIDEVTFISATQRRNRASGTSQSIARDDAPSRQLSREERKIQAIMRSFEAIEKQPKHRGRSSSAATDNGRDGRSTSPAEALLARQVKRDHRRQNSCPTESNLREEPVRETESRPKVEPKKYDPHKKDTTGRTQLHKHSKRGDVSVVRALLQAGADPNEKDNAGWTALHEAALHGRVEVMLLLLENGANVNSKGADLDTPLHDATENSHADGVKLLLEHGADPLACNANGARPAEIAAENDDKHIERMILAFCGQQGQVKKRRLVQAARLEGTKRKDASLPLLKRSAIDVDLQHHDHRHEQWMKLKAETLPPFTPQTPIESEPVILTTPPPERPSKLKVSKAIKEEDHDPLREAARFLPMYTMETVQHDRSAVVYVTELQVSLLLGMRAATFQQRYPHMRRVPVSTKEKACLWPSLEPMLRSAEAADAAGLSTTDMRDVKQVFLENEMCFVPLEQVRAIIGDSFGYLKDRLTLSVVEIPPLKCGLPPKFALKMQKCGRLGPSSRSSS